MSLFATLFLFTFQAVSPNAGTTSNLLLTSITKSDDLLVSLIFLVVPGHFAEPQLLQTTFLHPSNHSVVIAATQNMLSIKSSLSIPAMLGIYRHHIVKRIEIVRTISQLLSYHRL